jgi:Ras family protein A
MSWSAGTYFEIPGSITKSLSEHALVSIDGYQVMVEIRDTTHQEGFDRLLPLSYLDSHVILLCFRANNPTTETKKNILERWKLDLDHFCPGVPIILVGIKARDDSGDEGERPQPMAQGDDEDSFVPFTIRREIGSARYFFCDPRTGFGIRELTEYVRNPLISGASSTWHTALSFAPVSQPRRYAIAKLKWNRQFELLSGMATVRQRPVVES